MRYECLGDVCTLLTSANTLRCSKGGKNDDTEKVDWKKAGKAAASLAAPHPPLLALVVRVPSWPWLHPEAAPTIASPDSEINMTVAVIKAEVC